MDIEQLIKDCKRKNLKAQSDLYHIYKDTLYMLCLKYCKNTTDAQDNLHDAFLEIFKNIKKYNGSGSFEGWMKRITINKAINKYKKKKPINIVIKNDLLEDDQITDKIKSLDLDIILECIQQLPSQYRLVFNLYELDNYSHKEIAKLLSISLNTSKSNLHRAKLILKGKIEEIMMLQTKKQLKYGN